MKSDWLNDAQGAVDDLEKALTSGIDPSNRVRQFGIEHDLQGVEVVLYPDDQDLREAIAEVMRDRRYEIVVRNIRWVPPEDLRSSWQVARLWSERSCYQLRGMTGRGHKSRFVLSSGGGIMVDLSTRPEVSTDPRMISKSEECRRSL